MLKNIFIFIAFGAFSLPMNALYFFDTSRADKTIAEYLIKLDDYINNGSYTFDRPPSYHGLAAMSSGYAIRNGLMIGTLSAALNKLISSKRAHTKMVVAGTFTSLIASICYENHVWGKVPYYTSSYKKYSYKLEKHENYFENFNERFFARIFLATLAASFSFLGTQYALDKCSEEYEHYMSTETKEPLNQMLT